MKNKMTGYSIDKYRVTKFLFVFFFDIPSFEVVELGLSVRACVRACVRGSHFAYGQEGLEIGS